MTTRGRNSKFKMCLSLQQKIYSWLLSPEYHIPIYNGRKTLRDGWLMVIHIIIYYINYYFSFSLVADCVMSSPVRGFVCLTQKDIYLWSCIRIHSHTSEKINDINSKKLALSLICWAITVLYLCIAMLSDGNINGKWQILWDLQLFCFALFQ